MREDDLIFQAIQRAEAAEMGFVVIANLTPHEAN